MSLSKARQLREKRVALVADAQKLIPADGEQLTPENRAKFDTMMADAEVIKGDIDRLERAEALDKELRETVKPPEARIDAKGDPTAATDRAASVTQFRTALKRGARRGASPEAILASLRPEARAHVEQINDEYWDAMRNYLASESTSSMDPEKRALLFGEKPEYRDMGISVNTLGGYFVPQGFVYEIEEAMKWYGGMLEATGSIDTSTGQPLPWPTDNDTTNTGELVGEGVQVSTQDVTIGHITFNAWKYSTKMVKVSLELLQDSAFDIESYVKSKFAIRLGRKLNTDFTLGTGTNQPDGMITAIIAQNGTPQAWGAGSGPGIPLIAAGSSTNTGGAETGTTSIGSSDLFNLEHSVDKAYRKGAGYMFHDLTLRYAKTLLDKYGRPLWVASLKENAPDTINGYPYFVNNDMAQIAASAVTVAFGQLKKYTRRNVKELAIMRLNERFADYGQVAFIGFARKDGQLLDAGTHPVNYLIQHS